MNNPSPERRGAIILCGGQSTRMGQPKALLPFGDEVMLQRVVRRVAQAVPIENVVVVAAQGQTLPTLPQGVAVARDRAEARGPLEGLAAGLEALADRVDTAYLSGCDAPLLCSGWVREMFRRLGDADICVPRDGRYYHPLAAVYRSCVRSVVEALLAEDRLRPIFLFKQCRTIEVPVDAMRTVDPELSTLENLNRPEDYQAALKRLEADADS